MKSMGSGWENLKTQLALKGLRLLLCDQIRVSITFIYTGSDWRDAHKQTASKAHILPSCGLEMQLYRSISADYPDKPE